MLRGIVSLLTQPIKINRVVQHEEKPAAVTKPSKPLAMQTFYGTPPTNQPEANTDSSNLKNKRNT